MDVVNTFASQHGLWVVEDAAHSFPAAFRPGAGSPWRRCGEATSAVTCFSFYANKTITTGEGGMAVTAYAELDHRMRVMCLHGLSHDAWQRYSGGKNWDYRIVAPGFKYNLTDIAAAVGIHQLTRAEPMRAGREAVAQRYLAELSDVEEIELPPTNEDRLHAWHLFYLRLRLDRLTIDRGAFVDELKTAGIGCSVHWRPLHLHPYYEETYGWRPDELPASSAVWPRLVSLPIFSGMTDEEMSEVVVTVKAICRRHRR
jgi:perosamine synthetase